MSIFVELQLKIAVLSKTNSITSVQAQFGFKSFQQTFVFSTCFLGFQGSAKQTTTYESVVVKVSRSARFLPLMKIQIFSEISQSHMRELFYSIICYNIIILSFIHKLSKLNQILQFLSKMSFRFTTIVIFAFILFCLATSKIPRFPTPTQPQLQQSSQPLRYQTLYFDQKVSHYNFRHTGKTFKQKYLMDMTYWNKDAKGPILMYCGNQGPIEMFYKNTGWYNDYVSKQLKGLLLYPEHRYFGVSMPFGDQKTSYLKQNLVYLTTQQAMMDFVVFLKFIKKTYCKDCPVIAFGGSYGGMLATWMRMKYPFIIDAAHAASAPIYYYRNRQNFDIGIFYKIVTKNYQMHSKNCVDVIREGFKRLIKYSQNASAPTPIISNYFNLCKPLKSYKDIPILMQYIDDAYAYMAMLNYPYPTNFLKNLPAWPANSSCTPYSTLNISTSSSDKQLFNAIRESIEYYYSYGVKKCNQIYEDQSSDEDMSGWNILACSDQAMPMSTDGVKDMYYPSQFNYDEYSSYCNQTYSIMPDYDYTLNHFGGVNDVEYKQSSKIVFTNGGLDPWSGASPTSNLTSDLIACNIDFGAHHLDLRPPNPADPPSTHQCRDLVLRSLKKWIGIMDTDGQQEKEESIVNIRSQ